MSNGWTPASVLAALRDVLAAIPVPVEEGPVDPTRGGRYGYFQTFWTSGGPPDVSGAQFEDVAKAIDYMIWRLNAKCYCLGEPQITPTVLDEIDVAFLIDIEPRQ